MRDSTTANDPWAQEVPTLPFDGPSAGSYSDTVPFRQGYDDDGISDAGNMNDGRPVDAGDAFATMPQDGQGGNDSTWARLQGFQSIIGLTDEPTVFSPNAPQDMNGNGLVLARAGAPTDDGRLGGMVIRGNLGVDVWGQQDDGLGMKRESASPLAAPPFYAGQAVPDALPSAGGAGPALAAVDPFQANTWRVAPTPWDDLNYIGGPLDA